MPSSSLSPLETFPAFSALFLLSVGTFARKERLFTFCIAALAVGLVTVEFEENVPMICIQWN